MYQLTKNEPEWRPLFPGVEMLFAPASREIVLAGRKASRAFIDEQPEDALYDAMGSGAAFSLGVLQAAVLDFKGIGNPEGDALKFSPDALATALNDPHIFDAADRVYVVPIMQRDREKNVSATSPGGTSTKVTVDKTTAASAAKPLKTEAAGATNAPTVSTSQRPSKAKPSGKSLSD